MKSGAPLDLESADAYAHRATLFDRDLETYGISGVLQYGRKLRRDEQTLFPPRNIVCDLVWNLELKPPHDVALPVLFDEPLLDFLS
jgi:hypothetical protein